MAIRNILPAGNPRLRTAARPVDAIDERVLSILDDMAQTMYDARGVGLAAPQVGVRRRLVVIDVGEGLIELINPRVVFSEGTQRNVERCLSFPGAAGYVERPEKVRVEALDRNGNDITVEGTGLLAVALCHELDHLDGNVFVDKVTEWIRAHE